MQSLSPAFDGESSILIDRAEVSTALREQGTCWIKIVMRSGSGLDQNDSWNIGKTGPKGALQTLRTSKLLDIPHLPHAAFQQQGSAWADPAVKPLDETPMMAEPISIDIIDEGDGGFMPGNVFLQQRITGGDVGWVGIDQVENTFERVEMAALEQLDPLFQPMASQVAASDGECLGRNIDAHRTQIRTFQRQRNGHRP